MARKRRAPAPPKAWKIPKEEVHHREKLPRGKFHRLPPLVQLTLVEQMHGEMLYIPERLAWFDKMDRDGTMRVLHEEDGWTCKQIAETFNVTERTVERALSRTKPLRLREAKQRSSQFFRLLTQYRSLTNASARWFRAWWRPPRQHS